MGKLKADISKDEIFDNRCCAMLNSTIRDLCDPSFLDLFNRGKKAFLWYFTVTGIPISTKINNNSRMSLWKLRLELSDKSNVYPLVSHNILTSDDDEDIFIKKDSKRDEKINSSFKLDKNIVFNAVVPIFKPKVAAILKPLMKTNVFASICTFSILNNPNALLLDIRIFSGFIVLVDQINKF